MIFQPILVLLSTLLGFVSGGFFSSDFLTNGIYFGSYCFSITLVIAVLGLSVWGVVKPIAKRKIKYLERQLIKANELKEQFEKELIITKERKTTLSQEKTLENKSFSLMEQNKNELSFIEEQLQNTYNDNNNPKSKKLTLYNHKKRK